MRLIVLLLLLAASLSPALGAQSIVFKPRVSGAGNIVGEPFQPNAIIGQRPRICDLDKLQAQLAELVAQRSLRVAAIGDVTRQMQGSELSGSSPVQATQLAALKAQLDEHKRQLSLIDAAIRQLKKRIEGCR